MNCCNISTDRALRPSSRLRSMAWSGTCKSPVDITYLADTVMLLRYFEASGRSAPRHLGHQEAGRHS